MVAANLLRVNVTNYVNGNLTVVYLFTVTMCKPNTFFHLQACADGITSGLELGKPQPDASRKTFFERSNVVSDLLKNNINIHFVVKV